MTTQKSSTGKKLPAKSKDEIVEVNLREVLTGFVVLCGTVFVLGTGLLLVKDSLRFRRQKALIEGAKELITIITNLGGVTDEKDR